MKALQFDQTGDLSSLRFVDVPTPVSGADEVLVQIKAAGLNPSDVKNVLGRFPYTTLPRVPGRDFAGVVVEGPQALIGQEVWGTGRELGFFADGSHAQFVKLPANGVAHKPSHLSFTQAASLGVPWLHAAGNHDLDFDAALEGMEAELVSSEGDQARVKVTYPLLDESISFEMDMQRVGEGWYSADAIRQAEADLAEAGPEADVAQTPAPDADAATPGAGSAD